MCKFIFRCLLLVIIFIFFSFLIIHYDTFNVFHWNNIRFTSAEPNKNFIKTKYVIQNPTKFNAFVLGSSRVGNIPPDNLPKEINDKALHWYNMTCSEGLPSEHFLTLKTFLENGVSIEMIILGFDNIPMFASIKDHNTQLIRMPYQVYEKNLLSFYTAYLKSMPKLSIIKEIFLYKTAEHFEDTKIFYDYGVLKKNLNLDVSSESKIYDSAHCNYKYTQTDSWKDILEVCQLCKENGIKLILFSNPIYMTTYIDSVENGYFTFLRQVAQKCDFYNFSALNNLTMDSRYYFEGSHYRPALGLIVEKVLFGTKEECLQVRRYAGDDLFGISVTSENVDFVISELERQLYLYKKNTNNVKL